MDSSKFDSLLPVLWRQEDTTIYRVPQRSASLAHVMAPGSLAVRDARGTLAIDELRKYVTALDDPALPLVEMQWQGLRRMILDARLTPGQVISVQTSYHPGWHARSQGTKIDVQRDGLGFLVLRPQCSGQCPIELTYDGGWEYLLCRALSWVAVTGLAAYSGFCIWSWRRARSGSR